MKRIVPFVLMASALWAQEKGRIEPFGLHPGMTRQEIMALVGAGAVDATNSKGDVLVLDTAPRPHPSFETYSLSISPSDGLLKVVAIGKDIQTNGYGIEIMAAFHQTAEALAATYGTPQTADWLKPGSIWDEQREWTMGLLKRERELFALWNKDTRFSGIVLESVALSQEVGYLKLSYEFNGWERYVESKRAAQNNVF